MESGHTSMESRWNYIFQQALTSTSLEEDDIIDAWALNLALARKEYAEKGGEIFVNTRSLRYWCTMIFDPQLPDDEILPAGSLSYRIYSEAWDQMTQELRESSKPTQEQIHSQDAGRDTASTSTGGHGRARPWYKWDFPRAVEFPWKKAPMRAIPINTPSQPQEHTKNTSQKDRKEAQPGRCRVCSRR